MDLPGEKTYKKSNMDQERQW